MKRNRAVITDFLDEESYRDYPFENVWNLDEEENFIIDSIYYDYEDGEYDFDYYCYDLLKSDPFNRASKATLPHGWDIAHLEKWYLNFIEAMHEYVERIMESYKNFYFQSNFSK